jgi:signal transduction histidine kinase
VQLHPTPKQVFAFVSLALITVIGATTSVSQAVFFRQAIIEREAKIIDDVVDAVAIGADAAPPDMEDFQSRAIQREFTRRFSQLKNLPGVVRIKVFRRDTTIAWSDDAALIGTHQTRHPGELQRALQGEIRTVFDPLEQVVYAVGQLPPEPLIEFYVPFSWAGPLAGNSRVDGVVALYRSPKELNVTILNGLLLLWLVTAVGGGILFLAIFVLYRSIYDRHREIEGAFAQFTQEQERVIQIEKLSAVGQMVTEIAHQLNNPLVGVINLAALAEREAGDTAKLRELLHGVQEAGKHCRDFVQRMLRLNATARSEPKPTDVAELARETVTLFKQSCAHPPDIALEVPPYPLVLQVDPVLIRHALFNLLSNAAQADPRGRITVSVAREERQGTAGCGIEVADTGEGFTPDVAAKLFTPFFTTRPGGTGLGLLVVQQIVVKHRGHVRAENLASGGARFAMWLPLRLDSLKEK